MGVGLLTIGFAVERIDNIPHHSYVCITGRGAGGIAWLRAAFILAVL